MSLNQKIIINLKSLFLKDFKEIQHQSLSQWINLLETENPDVFSINQQKTVKFYDESVIQNFKVAKRNKKLLKCYEKAIGFDIHETEIINGFSENQYHLSKQSKRELAKLKIQKFK